MAGATATSGARSRDGARVTMLLRCEPAELAFKPLPSGAAPPQGFTLRNTDAVSAVAFKVRTTEPRRFGVAPVCGLIAPGQEVTVRVTLKKNAAPAEGEAEAPVPFRIMATRVQEADRAAFAVGQSARERREQDQAAAAFAAAPAAEVEQHRLSARVSARAAPVVDMIAARTAVMGGGLLVEPRTLQLDASPSVTLSLGKLTLRRPPAPPTTTAPPGVLLWKFRTTEPGVYAVRPAMGVFLSGAGGASETVTVTVTRRTVSSGRRANGGATPRDAAPPKLKLTSVNLGANFSLCPAAAAVCGSSGSTAGATALWKLIVDTPLLAAASVHQFVDIALTTPAGRARDRAAAAIISAAPIAGPRPATAAMRTTSGRARLPAAPAPMAEAMQSPATCHVEQSADAWAAQIHRQQRQGSDGRQRAAAVPEYFLDPILGRVFVDPVTTEVGNTYERSSIEKWLASGARPSSLLGTAFSSPFVAAFWPDFGVNCASGKRTDPLTNAVLEDTRLVPNNVLRSQIQAWRAAAPCGEPASNATLAYNDAEMELEEQSPPTLECAKGGSTPGANVVAGIGGVRRRPLCAQSRLLREPAAEGGERSSLGELCANAS